MLKIIKKYKFSLFLASAFHVMLFSVIFMNWQPEQKHSKKIVLKQGDVIKATAVPIKQFEDKIKEIKQNKQKKKQAIEKKKKIARAKKKEQRRKEVARKKEIARKKDQQRKAVAKKKVAEKKRKALAKKKAEKKKKLEKQKQKKAADAKKKKLKAEKLKKEKTKAEKLKREKIKKEKLKKDKQKKEKQRKEAEKRRKQAEKMRQQEIAAESARLEAQRVQREKGIVNRYARLIQNKITRYWRRPSNVETKMRCTLNIRMTPNGEVISVKVTKGSGNFAFDRAAEKAVTGASPLPVPKDRTLFEKDFRNLTINYEK
jgi:colicin import membrane protein